MKISPWTSVTHDGAYITDGDLGSIDLPTEMMHRNFTGKYKNVYKLNAADRALDPVTGKRRLLLALREDCLLHSPVSGYLYVKKNDVLSMDWSSGAYSVILRGSKYNVPGIDAVAAMENGNIIFSPDGPFYYQSSFWGGFYFHEEDLILYLPAYDVLVPFVSGHILGITSLDAVEFYGGTLYFSVRDPVYVNVGLTDSNTVDAQAGLEIGVSQGTGPIVLTR